MKIPMHHTVRCAATGAVSDRSEIVFLQFLVSSANYLPTMFCRFSGYRAPCIGKAANAVVVMLPDSHRAVHSIEESTLRIKEQISGLFGNWLISGLRYYLPNLLIGSLQPPEPIQDSLLFWHGMPATAKTLVEPQYSQKW
jgi:hypothetical protein